MKKYGIATLEKPELFEHSCFVKHTFAKKIIFLIKDKKKTTKLVNCDEKVLKK